MRQIATCLLIGSLNLIGFHATGQSSPDTLALARLHQEKGRLRDASRLLVAWNKAHPLDANAYWLHAQIEYRRKKFGRSERLYRKSIALLPDNLYLRLDFAEALLNMGRLSKASAVLSHLSRKDRNEPHALYVLSRHAYWTGDIKKAKRLVKASKKVKTTPSNLALTNEIDQALSLWVNLGTEALIDDQPLQKIEPQVMVGKHLGRNLNLGGQASTSFFQTDSLQVRAVGLNVSNRMQLTRFGTSLDVQAGVFQLGNNGPMLTGRLSASQRLPEGLSLMAEISRNPTLRNVSSLETTVVEHQLRSTINWQQRHGLLANLGVQTSRYQDGNTILSSWAWMLSPPLAIQKVSFRAGYGYSFADSRENRFEATKDLSELLNPFDPDAMIQGVFTPYFTPENMHVHAALAQMECRFSKKLRGYVHGKYGFLASALNPYLFLNTAPNGDLFIQRDFIEMTFKPMEIGAKLLLQLRQDLFLEAHYSFSRNFFYESHVAGLFMKKSFGK